MLGYYFSIIYKKEKENMVVDAFSRKEKDTKALICVIYIL
jgi:hypothetical protein